MKLSTFGKSLCLMPVFLLIACASTLKPPKYYVNPELPTDFELASTIRSDSLNLELLEWAIYSETNRQRQRLGLAPFIFDVRLRDAALSHSREMVDLDYFDHESPINDNKSIRKRLDRAGVKFGVGGENLAIHPLNKKQEVVYNSVSRNQEELTRYTWRNAGTRYNYREFAEALVLRWLNSPPHRRNILDTRFKYLGVGCASTHSDQDVILYVTQNFSSTNY